jgi:streptomycin 6-kinase
VPVAVPVPSGLARTAAQVWGDVGRRWVGGLPGVLRSLLADWDLTPGELFQPSLHWVAAVTTGDGISAVLKVGPVEPRHLPVEAEALRLFAGHGSVRLLREDPARGALLLERVSPGTSLDRLVPGSDAEATAVLVHTIRALHRPAPCGCRLPAVLGQRSDLDEHVRMHGLLPARLVARASGLFAELGADVTEPAVLHGDLHHGNVLRSHRSPWLAIDPHGSVGDPGYEIGSVLFNPDPADRDPALLALVPGRVEQLADGLGLPVDRVVAWGFVKAVLSQVWTCERVGARVTRALDVALLLEPRLR